jgi:hypothetical protein
MSRERRERGRHRHGDGRAAPRVCFLCKEPVLLGHLVMTGDRFGKESCGVICDDCHQAMIDDCLICQEETAP